MQTKGHSCNLLRDTVSAMQRHHVVVIGESERDMREKERLERGGRERKGEVDGGGEGEREREREREKREKEREREGERERGGRVDREAEE